MIRFSASAVEIKAFLRKLKKEQYVSEDEKLFATLCKECSLTVPQGRRILVDYAVSKARKNR